MSRKNWDKVADKEFDAMPKKWQEDWKDLKSAVAK